MMATWQIYIADIYQITIMGKWDDIMGLINRRRIAYNEHNHGKCRDFCYVKINDFGQIQCSSCLALLDKKIIKFHLEKQYGEFWEEKYKELIRLQKRVRSGKIKKIPTRHNYINNRGEDISREYYE